MTLAATGPLSSNDPAFASFDELDDFGDFFCLGQFFLHRFDCLPRVVLRTVNQAKCFLDELNAFVRKIFALQTDEIHPANFRWIPISDHERRDVLNNFRATPGNSEPADPAKLMDGGESAHYRIVSHLYVAT